MGGRRAELSEEYLSQVAHEFRGSLNAILGWAEFLRGGPCDDVSRTRAAETIIRHARQQSWMVAEFFDIWRLASGTLKFSIGTFDLAQVARDAIAAVQPLAGAKDVRVEFRTDASAARSARGDAKRLTQGITTLLANAIHFAPENSVVSMRLDGFHGAGRLTIHDDGPAVPPAALPYLFERDRPAAGGGRDSPRASFRLGLSLVRDVVTRHRGSIEAESAGEDGGMTFRLTIPTDSRAESTASITDLAAEIREFAPAQLDGLRVLLVDDEVDAREALSGILTYYGAIVQPAGSAAEAIAAIQHERFDVLLADIGMPGADGYDLIRYVRGLESAAQLPAVAVTAFASDADRRRALDAGFQVHLSKPVDPAALVATVAVVGRPAASIR